MHTQSFIYIYIYVYVQNLSISISRARAQTLIQNPFVCIHDHLYTYIYIHDPLHTYIYVYAQNFPCLYFARSRANSSYRILSCASKIFDIYIYIYIYIYKIFSVSKQSLARSRDSVSVYIQNLLCYRNDFVSFRYSIYTLYIYSVYICMYTKSSLLSNDYRVTERARAHKHSHPLSLTYVRTKS